MALRLDGLFNGEDDGLAFLEAGDDLQILSDGAAGDGHAVGVNESLGLEVLEEGGGAADLVNVLHDVLAGGLEVAEEGGTVTHALEVLECEGDADGTGHGNEVEDGISGSTSGHDGDHGVFKGLVRENVTGFEVLAEELNHVLTGEAALLGFEGVLGGDGGGVGNAHAHGLDGAGHGVGGVHATTGAGARAGVANDVATTLLGDLTGGKSTEALEGGDNIEDAAINRAVSRLDGAAIDHKGRAVQPSHGNDSTGHVLVATGKRNVTIIPLSAHDGFNAVGDDIA
mmetsp:Transcript_25216/g.45756  ORF Transcript_25216/g.45756 Transcript_25216/m.45756 type:complete len:284 (-) Transcript_25216:500-1351(-)